MVAHSETFSWGQFVYYGKKLRDLEATADRFIEHVQLQGWIEMSNSNPTPSKGVGFEKKVSFSVADMLGIRRERGRNEADLRQLKYRLACVLNENFAGIGGELRDAFTTSQKYLEEQGLISEVREIVLLMRVIRGDATLEANIAEH